MKIWCHPCTSTPNDPAALANMQENTAEPLQYGHPRATKMHPDHDWWGVLISGGK